MLHGVLCPLVIVCALLAPILLSQHLQPATTHVGSHVSSPQATVSPGGTSDRLFWFVHVSDVHINQFDPKREARFRAWCREDLVQTLRPAFVIATGDLTDAKKEKPYYPGALGQKHVEWNAYRTAVEDAGLLSQDETGAVASPWFDLRGNHDAFDVPHPSSPLNLYRSYGVTPFYLDQTGHTQDGVELTQEVLHLPRSFEFVRPRDGTSHYSFTFRPGFGEYKFIALDFSLSEASARHFFGEFTKSASAFLEEQAMSSEGTTVTLGHFPVSSVMHAGTSPTTLLRGVASHTLPQKSTNGSAAAVESTPSLYGALAQHHVIAHFCGHFHGLLGKVVHSWFGEYLQARHEGGTLELEVGDFVSRRRYRIVAFDHDIMSFADHHHEEWPSILVTNPKDARYTSPFEPTSVALASSHIRALVFSPDVVESVTISVDGGPVLVATPAAPPRDATTAAGPGVGAAAPLWVAAWDPTKLSRGLHRLEVTARDAAGRVRSVNHLFSLDGTVPPFDSAFSVWVMTGNLKHHVDAFVGFALLWTLGFAVLAPYAVLHRIRASVDRGARDTGVRGAKDHSTITERYNAAVASWLEKHLTRGHGLRVGGTAGFHRRLWCSIVNATYTGLVPYITLAHRRPRVFASFLWFHAVMLLGPWFVGRFFAQDWASAWSWGMLLSDGTVLAHHDAGITMFRMLVERIAPLIQLLSMTAVVDQMSSLRSTPVTHTTIWFPSPCAKRQVAATTCVVGMCIMLAVKHQLKSLGMFYGLDSVLLSPMITWHGVFAMYLVVKEVVIRVKAC